VALEIRGRILPNTPAKPPGVSPSSARYEALSRLRAMSGVFAHGSSARPRPPA
jgi:hypothetical protein